MNLPQEKKIAGMIRRCLSSRYIIRSRQKDLFIKLITYHKDLTKFFNTMGVELVINEDIGIAYLQTQPEVDEELDYKFGRQIQLSALETLMLLYVRQKRIDHYTGHLENETPLIGLKDLREFLTEFNFEKEDRKFQQRFERSINQMIGHQIILATKNPEQFEISPVCDVVLPADKISRLNSQAQSYFNSNSGVQ